MRGTHDLGLFILSGLLLNVMPGPDSLLIMARSAAHGFRAGSAAALGIGAGTCVHVLAAALGLSALLDRYPRQLSGGQRQRVALARALVHRPRLLLLDEPLGALDALTRIDMQNLIEGLWQRLGFTAVLVTHDVAEAVALADRVVLIEDGRITLDEHIDLPRPRHRGSPAFARLEEAILNRVMSLYGPKTMEYRKQGIASLSSGFGNPT